MAEELRRELHVEAELVPGSKGIFDVIVDGKTVFSKFKAHRFPNPGEIVNGVKKT